MMYRFLDFYIVTPDPFADMDGVLVQGEGKSDLDVHNYV